MIKGNAVSPGFGIGKLVKILPVIIETKKPENLEDEKNKLNDAISKLITNYNNIINDINQKKDIKEIIEIYKMMVSSDSFKKKIIDVINENIDVITAIDIVAKEEQNNFKNMSNDYFKERSNDVLEIGKNLISIILGNNEKLKDISSDVILSSKEITASDLMSINKDFVKGVVSLIGGKTSHVALLAKSMGIPVIFNINIDELSDNEFYFIDGYKGELIKINSDEKAKYQELVDKQIEKEKLFDSMIDKKGITTDGKLFEVCANASELDQIDNIIKVNPDGVGLFRTEFLFLNRINAPSFEEQFNVYKSYAEKLGNKPLIIRTLDIGGDKVVDYLNISKEDNSFLGYRAIRYCMGNIPLFKAHLKAILMASYYGNVMIMFPMVSNIEEIRTLKNIVEDVKKELIKESIPFKEDIKLGIMIEIPSVAIIADLIIDEVDFFSLGTNDLTQYTLAVDRTNEKISHLYNYFDPAVIRLMKHSIDVVPNNKFIGMCGEVAADPYAVVLLVGLGLSEFSVNQRSVLKVKKWISLLNYEDCKKVANKVLSLKTATEVEEYLKEYANVYLKDYL